MHPGHLDELSGLEVIPSPPFPSLQVGIQGQGVAEVAQFITTNFIPITFVILLLLQFLSMLIDR